MNTLPRHIRSKLTEIAEHQVIPNQVITAAPMTVLSVQNRGFGCLPGPASCRTASFSSFIGNGNQSLNKTRERFERATNEFPFAAELLKISTM
jgi:hypothetical protein